MIKLKSLLTIVAPLVALCFSTAITQAQSPDGGGATPRQDTDTKGKGSVGPSGKFVPKPARVDPNAKKITPEEARANLLKALKLEDLGGGKYRLGKVTLDKKARTVSFSVTVNMISGVVEYVLVTEKGKAHEAIFTTAASPTQIHLACVLLGMKELKGRDWPKEHSAIPAHQGVSVEVTWPTNGPPKRLPLSRFVVKKNMSQHGVEGKPVKEGSWLYNGSHFSGGVFAAEREGSIISIIGDGTALLNGLRAGHEDDMMHSANTKVLPKKGLSVKMVLTLPKPVKLENPAKTGK